MANDSAGSVTRPSRLSDADESDLLVYVAVSLLVGRLLSDDAEERQFVRGTLLKRGISADRLLILVDQDAHAAVRYAMEDNPDAMLSDDCQDKCRQLLEDDSIRDYISGRLAEWSIANSGLVIQGVVIGGDERQPQMAQVAAEDSRGGRILDRHFSYQEEIENSYRLRNSDPTALERAILACERQIAIATDSSVAFRQQWPHEPLPLHVGFRQLAIIREKQGDYQGAIQLAEQALRQGWGGDWENRIARCMKKRSAAQ